MFFYKCKFLRVYDTSLPIRVYLISTSLLKLTSLTALRASIDEVMDMNDKIMRMYNKFMGREEEVI